MMLKPLELLYHLASATKNTLYDLNLIQSKKLTVPVISIGNLSFGGTGKTPFIQFVAENLKATKKIAIVSKSYKAQLKQAQRVDLNRENPAAFYGDEACLLQKSLPFCSVWSGPQK